MLPRRCGELTGDQKPLQHSLPCDFRLEVFGKERLAGKYEEGSKRASSLAPGGARKTEVLAQSEFPVFVQKSSHFA